MSFVPTSGPATLASAEPPRDATVEFTGEGRRSVSLPIAAALPVLTRAHREATGEGDVHSSVLLLAGAAHLALRLVADGRFAPHADELWWEPVLDAATDDRIVQLAAARAADGMDAAAAEGLARRMVDAVVDATPRRAPQESRTTRTTGAAAARSALRAARATDSPPDDGLTWAERQAQVKARTSAEYAHVLQDRLTRLRRQRGTDDRPHLVRLSLRIDAPDEQLYAGELTVVPQVHAEGNDLHVADAALLWAESGPDASHGFGDRARTHASLAIRQAADAWQPLSRLLELRVPDALVLGSDEVTDLLEHGLEALQKIGVDVHWPRSIGRGLSTEAVLDREPRKGTAADGSAASEGEGPLFEGQLQTSTLRAQDLFSFTWQVSLRGEALDEAEMEALAQATTPMIRLRDNWVVVDPTTAKRARRRLIRTASAPEAVAAALTGVAPLAVTGFAHVEDEIAHVKVHAGASVQRLAELIRNSTTAEPVPIPSGLAATLREYQHQGLTWLATMTDLGLGACLADDMGLGKTITLISLHLHRLENATALRPAGPTLVVCPASLLGNWEAEISRFAPGVPVRRFHGSGRSLDGVSDGFVLTTYGTLRSDVESDEPRLTSLGWDLVVADEAQHIKNSRSATARALRKVDSAARVALTGTPVENNLTELWSLFDWGVPGLLGSRLAFRRVWAAPIEAGVDTAVTRRFADLIAPFLLRRRKSDPGIAPELPPKTETDHVLGLSTEQAVLYEAFVKDRMERIERSDAVERRGLVLAMLTGLKQICNHPAQFLKQANPRIAGRSEKFDLLDELVGTVLAEDGAVLIFTQYVAMARLVEQHLTRSGIPHQFLHGGTPVPEREAMVRRFQSEDGADRVPVFILSLKAGGTGLNLTRADHVIHLDRWWNPAVEEQATDRAYRIGQTKPVQVHRMITRGTVEERVAALLERKRDLADAVLSNGEAALTELSNDDLRDLVTLR